MSFDIVDYQEVATSRYTDLFKGDVVFDAIVKSIIAPLQSYQIFLKDFHDNFLDIDNSFGQQLDIIGGIVGQPRVLLNFLTEPYFGFKGAANAESFGTEADSGVGGYWRSILNPISGSAKTLDDITYRKLIKARIIKNKSKGSINDFLLVMNILTGNTLTRVDVAPISGTALVTLVEPVDPLVGYYLGKVRESGSLIPLPLGVKLSVSTVQLPLPVYTLSASEVEISAGESVVITLSTTNVSDGALLPYTITGVSSGDIDVPLTGFFEVIGGYAELVIMVLTDESGLILVLSLDELDVAVEVNINNAPEYNTVILADNPVAYYPLNEVSGDIIADIMPSPANGTAFGVTLNQSPIHAALGASALFNGSSSSINLPAASKFNIAGEITIEFWIVPNNTAGTGTIFSANFNSGLREQLARQALTTIYNGAAITTTPPIFIDSSAYHVVITCAASGSATWVNGINTASSAVPWGSTPNLGWAIGSAINGTYSLEFFNGKISNVAIYSHLLPAERIGAHYAAGLA